LDERYLQFSERVNVVKKILIFSLLFASGTAFSQVAPTVRGANSSLSVGGEFSSFDSDYDNVTRLIGIGALVDYNLTPKLGLVGEARWLQWNGHGGQSQQDYLLGAKYRLYQWHRFSFNAKFVLGGVWITYPDQIGTGSYFAIAPGGFVDYHLTRRFSIRGDYEYQFLPSAPGFAGFPSNGLNPNGFSVGVMYRLLGR
jgi:predicted porin